MNEIQKDNSANAKIDEVQNKGKIPLSNAIIIIGSVVLTTVFIYTRNDPGDFVEHNGGTVMIVGLIFGGIGHSIRSIIRRYRQKSQKN